MVQNKTILRRPALLRPIIVREIYRRNGRAIIWENNRPGPDRDIYRIVARELGVTEDELRLKMGDLVDFSRTNRKPSNDAGRNAWEYTMLVGVQHLKERDGYLEKGSPKGVWELTPSGLEYGRRLMISGVCSQ